MYELPVAALALDETGHTVGATCPACGRVIKGKGPFQTAERYATHYHREHRTNDNDSNQVPDHVA